MSDIRSDDSLTLGPWFRAQGLRTMEQVADEIISLQRQVLHYQGEAARLRLELCAAQKLTNTDG